MTTPTNERRIVSSVTNDPIAPDVLREAVAAALFGDGWQGPYAPGTYSLGSRIGHAYTGADAVLAVVAKHAPSGS